jgi:Putative Zn-dependent protease, contains TPR repeats
MRPATAHKIVMRKNSLIISLALSAAFWSFGCSKTGVATPETTVSAATIAPERQQEVATAEALIEKLPDSAAGYRALATAYVRIGRETGDPIYAEKAISTLEKGLGLAPGDIVLRKLKATVLLSDHQFRDAREIGRVLQIELPKDPYVLGILTDANAELGDYKEAAEFAQKMVDMRPDSSSYARAAHIRALYGDHEGSVELYKLAARTTDPGDKEAQAWSLAQLGNEFWRNGKYDESLRVYDESLQVMPGYHHALFGKGRTLASKGDLAGAKENLIESQTRSAGIDTVLLLGDVYRKLGDSENAGKQYAMAEGGEATLGAHYDEHRMALFWADNDKNLDRALEVAIADFAEIKDIYASDILAWSYYKKGMFAEAKAQAELAMRLKTRDARIYYHAGMIELALGNRSAAKKHLQTALQINPKFDLTKADSAVATLNTLG